MKEIDALNKEERKQRIELLELRTKLYRKAHKAGNLTPEQKKDFLIDLREIERLKRIDRSEEDILYFMYEYFSDNRNSENDQNLIPMGTTIENAPKFHRELCELLDEVSNMNTTARIAWAAPRGHAKSAYLSNCFPVHEIVFNKRKYILIISETDTSAKKFIEWISLQLKFNKKLREDFGDLLAQQKALNIRDNQEAFLTTNGILVEAASMGKQLRGKRNGSYRPDLVICDDLESAKNTNTPELREKNLYWFNSVVIPIGDPARTAFVYMGTIVHGRGLLPTILERADFESKVYSAIVSPPEREDLWAEFEEIYRNPGNDRRQDDALAFYWIVEQKAQNITWEGALKDFLLFKKAESNSERTLNEDYGFHLNYYFVKSKTIISSDTGAAILLEHLQWLTASQYLSVYRYGRSPRTTIVRSVCLKH